MSKETAHFCSACGSGNVEGDNFCFKCGYDLKQTSVITTDKPPLHQGEQWVILLGDVSVETDLGSTRGNLFVTNQRFAFIRVKSGNSSLVPMLFGVAGVIAEEGIRYGVRKTRGPKPSPKTLDDLLASDKKNCEINFSVVNSVTPIKRWPSTNLLNIEYRDDRGKLCKMQLRISQEHSEKMQRILPTLSARFALPT